MKKALVYLTKNKAFIGFGKDTANLTAYEWDGINLLSLFEKIESGENFEFKLLLGNEFIYSTVFSTNERGSDITAILEEASKHFPIDVTFDNFYFQSVDFEKVTTVYGFAVKDEFEKNVSKALSKYKITAIHPSEKLLADYFIEKDAIALFYKGIESLVIVVKDGFAYSSLLTADFEEKNVTSFLKNCERTYSLKIKKFVLAGIDLNIQPDPDITVEKIEIDLLADVEAGKVPKHTSELSDLLHKRRGKKAENNLPIERVSSKKTKSTNIVRTTLAVSLVMVLAIAAFVIVNRIQQPKNADRIEAAPVEITVSPEEVITPTIPIDIYNYSIDVLNGSSKAGLAKKVSELLEEGGFKNLTIGNADAKDYKNTEVRIKEGLQGDVFSPIKALLPEYNAKLGDPLPVDYESDVVIVIGN